MLEVPLWRSYLAGCILLGVAPCTAMVLVWGYSLAATTASRWSWWRSTRSRCWCSTACSADSCSASAACRCRGRRCCCRSACTSRCRSWRALLAQVDHRRQGRDVVQGRFLHVLTPVTIMALLVTLVLLFSFKGEVIAANPLTILWIASRCSSRRSSSSGSATGWRALKLSYDNAAPRR